ncbi:MAG: metal ABC transporter substrate-binding protein [Treponema sp.]|nr:metal ABC transporter substrate-binding protein [Treponema sp.]
MKLRKMIAGAAILLALTTSLFAAKAKKVKVVTTIFPEYDWAREIIGDKAKNVELTLLMGNGVDLHSYQPSIKDIAKISTSDIFIYVGGESDDWVKDALKNAKNKDMKVINLMEVLEGKVKAEEMKEGMQASEHHHHHEDADHDDHDDDDDDHDHEHEDADHDDHDHDHDHEHEAEAHEHEHHHHDDEDEDEHEHHHHHDGEVEYDEHVWLSVRFAKILCGEICQALCEKDAANEATYKTNLAAYTAKLDSLDSKFAAAVNNGSKKTLLFGDRFPFRYFVEDYGLEYFAAFVGCSAETEASFETIIFLAKKVDELGLKCIFKIESGDGKIANTIVQNTKAKNAKVLTLDSIQSTTLKQANSGSTYLSIMEKNLKVIEEALK